ncbi:MAG: radical SAM protein, partial [Candidatus Aureabacteria bacterium]|nr:radical SAM protein [Candidatus Auribacterota bacterium]
TRRGVLWLGQTCNLRCHFCYFLDRIESRSHKEHDFMSLEKAKQICYQLKNFYNNNSVDLQGGEPTIYKDIYELVSYCRSIGLYPSLITNALVLSDKDKCRKLSESGIRDCLVSVHGLNETFDKIVRVKGASKKLMQGLENLVEAGVPVRFNCVLSKMALPELKEIALLAVKLGARVVNFITFNPFEDQLRKGKRSTENVPRYSEVAPHLDEALDILSENNIEGNVRYFPICMVKEAHRKSVYDFQQLPYDIHEWDYVSWTWTSMTPQKIKEGDLSHPVSLRDISMRSMNVPESLHFAASSMQKFLSLFPFLLSPTKKIYHKMSFLINRFSSKKKDFENKEAFYLENAKYRRNLGGYVYSFKCQQCAARDICDGFHGDYASIFGSEEALPVRIDKKIVDPKYFISDQQKVVEKEDYDWAL